MINRVSTIRHCVIKFYYHWRGTNRADIEYVADRAKKYCMNIIPLKYPSGEYLFNRTINTILSVVH